MTKSLPAPRSQKWVLLAIILLLAGLPLAVWLDLRTLAETALSRQAGDFNALITSVRDYYASNIVSRVLSGPGSTTVTHNYHSIPGAIPIPATLSLELGQVVSERQTNVAYRFVSDYPFENRAPHSLDDFEKAALLSLRRQPNQQILHSSWSLLSSEVRLVTPVIMEETCVACHNTHPESPKRDWKIGDVRGIQEVTVTQPLAANIFSFKFLLVYMALAATAGIGFILLQKRQAAVIGGMNRDLEDANAFLADISLKISRYLAPQIYKSIFSGEKDVTIHTERKKLTIFFSDIKDFTATTERLQPEEMTRLLNEYFTEMSAIALKHGGTIDKFIGDALLIFFGDPETRGAEQDAKACLAMAVEMQRKLAELNAGWRRHGTEEPFRVRMGINSGFCNVGNFGSTHRMDYTIIGAEANLAARLQSIAEPGRIVISFETYALVRETVTAHPLPPIHMKGISREVVPYVVEELLEEGGRRIEILSEHAPGMDLYIDTGAIADANEVRRIRARLVEAVSALDRLARD